MHEAWEGVNGLQATMHGVVVSVSQVRGSVWIELKENNTLDVEVACGRSGGRQAEK